MYESCIHEQSVPTNILSQFTKTSTIHKYYQITVEWMLQRESFQNWVNKKIFCKDWCIDLELYPLLC